MKISHNIKNISASSITTSSRGRVVASVDWSYYNQFEHVNDKYLPSTGEGDTKATQLVTCVNKLVYKWYNDGDVFDNNYGLDGWCNDLSSYANWLYNCVPESKVILSGIKDIFMDSDYEELLQVLTETLFDERLLARYDKEPKAGSIYTAEGPFEFTEFNDEYDEYDDEYYDEDDEDICSAESLESSDAIGVDYAFDTDTQRYIHSLIYTISDLLEAEGYDVSIEQTDNALLISKYPAGSDNCEGEYSFPISALNVAEFDIESEGKKIVDILMNRASFEDIYSSENLYYDDEELDSEWSELATKQVPDSDGFLTDYTLYVNSDKTKYICMFGDKDAYTPDEDYADYDCDSEETAYSWFNSYSGFGEEYDGDEIYGADIGVAEAEDGDVITADLFDDDYYGKTEASKYGQQIIDKLKGKTVSKRIALGELPGGLVYEANELGIDMWDLLKALEGLCHEGKASEIDDSTYEIFGATNANNKVDIDIDPDKLEKAIRSLYGDIKNNLYEYEDNYPDVDFSYIDSPEDIDMATFLYIKYDLVDGEDYQLMQGGTDILIDDASNSIWKTVAADLNYSDEDESGRYTVIETKYVLNANKQKIKYTMFRDINSGEYVFVLGTDDPDAVTDSIIDWRVDNEAEAWNWFDSYHGQSDGKCTVELFLNTDGTLSTDNFDDEYLIGEFEAVDEYDAFIKALCFWNDDDNADEYIEDYPDINSCIAELRSFNLADREPIVSRVIFNGKILFNSVLNIDPSKFN